MLDESAANGARTAGEAIVTIYKALGGKEAYDSFSGIAKAIDYYFENYPGGSGYLTIEPIRTYIQVGSQIFELQHIINNKLPKGRGNFMIRVEKGQIIRATRVLWKESTSSK